MVLLPSLMLDGCALIALVAAVTFAGASIAGTRETTPAEAFRPCSSRGDGSKPQALPTPVGERIGPLVIWPSIRSRVEDYATSKAGWAYYAKAPIVLPARTTVTLVVPSEAKQLIGFQAAGGA